MRWKRAMGRDVIDITSAETIGKIDGMIIDAESSRVTAVIVDKKIVGWDDGGGVGKDAFTLNGADVLREPETEAEQAAVKGSVDPIGKQVITEEGTQIGSIVDIDFDAESGAIRELVLADDEVTGSRLMGVGSFAVVVSAPSRASTSSDGLGSLSKGELYEMAKERDLSGRSTMSKKELVAALS